VDELMGDCPDLDGSGVDAPGELPEELFSSLSAYFFGGFVLSGLDVGEVEGELVDPVSEPSFHSYYCVVVAAGLKWLATWASEGTGPHEYISLYLIGRDAAIILPLTRYITFYS
jgi:hypothetical protein